MQSCILDYKNTDLKIIEAYRKLLKNLSNTQSQLKKKILGVKASSDRKVEYFRRIIGE